MASNLTELWCLTRNTGRFGVAASSWLSFPRLEAVEGEAVESSAEVSSLANLEGEVPKSLTLRHARRELDSAGFVAGGRIPGAEELDWRSWKRQLNLSTVVPRIAGREANDGRQHLKHRIGGQRVAEKDMQRGQSRQEERVERVQSGEVKEGDTREVEALEASGRRVIGAGARG